MAKKKKYVDGGKLASAASAVPNIVGSFAQNAQLNNTSGLESNLYNAQNYQVSANNFDDLINEQMSKPIVQNINASDVDKEFWEKTGNTLNSMASGAVGGSAFGGVGALVEAGIGLLSGLFGGITGTYRANKYANDYNEKAEAANKLVNIKFNDKINSIKNTQFNNMMSNFVAYGGPLNSNGADFSNGITFFNEGGTHEVNPYGGILQGIAQDGEPNFVEEGEVKYKDYIFSNRLTVPKTFREKYKLGKKKDLTFADAAKKMQAESEERPNDPISKRGLEDSMIKLQMAQEELKQENVMKEYAKGGRLGHQFEGGGSSHRGSVALIDPINFIKDTRTAEELGLVDDFDINAAIARQTLSADRMVNDPNWVPAISTPLVLKSKAELSQKVQDAAKPSPKKPINVGKNVNKSNWQSLLQYMPAVTSGISTLIDALTPADYSNAERIERASNSIPTVNYNPIGNYLTYKPFDRNYYLNKLDAQTASTREAIINNANGNRAVANANLLALDYNSAIKAGELARQAEEYNLNQRQMVENFNRGTNQYNSEAALKTAMANQDVYKTRLNGITQAAMLRDQIESAKSASTSQNLSNFSDNLGSIGKMYASANLINNNPASYYDIFFDEFGGQGIRYRNDNNRKNGEYLTIKNKRRK